MTHSTPREFWLHDSEVVKCSHDWKADRAEAKQASCIRRGRPVHVRHIFLRMSANVTAVLSPQNPLPKTATSYTVSN